MILVQLSPLSFRCEILLLLAKIYGGTNFLYDVIFNKPWCILREPVAGCNYLLNNEMTTTAKRMEQVNEIMARWLQLLIIVIHFDVYRCIGFYISSLDRDRKSLC